MEVQVINETSSGLDLSDLAIQHPPVPTCTVGLDTLGDDVLLLIFYQLHQGDRESRESLQILRYVSRRISYAATPLRYRVIPLTIKLVSDLENPYIQIAWGHIQSFARRIKISIELGDMALAMIIGCIHLESITWEWYSACYGDTYAIPLQLQEALLRKWPQCVVRIRDYAFPLGPDLDIQSIPTSRVTYISCTRGQCIADTTQLRAVIAACSNLHTFHIFCTLNGGFTCSGPRFPAIKRLGVIGCNWPYTIEEVNQLWDFSRLVSITYFGDQALSFLSSLPSSVSPGLKLLHLRPDYSTSTSGVGAAAIARFISHMHSIKYLFLVCNTPSIPFKQISGWGNQLRRLHIEDHVGFGNRNIKCPALSEPDLVAIEFGCPRLRDISLDLDWKSCNVMKHVEILCRFRNVEEIELRMQTLLDEDVVNINIDPVDVDHEVVKSIVSSLSKRKLGLRLTSLTINVGGYTRPKGNQEVPSQDQIKSSSSKRLFKFQWTMEDVLTTSIVRSPY